MAIKNKRKLQEVETNETTGDVKVKVKKIKKDNGKVKKELKEQSVEEKLIVESNGESSGSAETKMVNEKVKAVKKKYDGDELDLKNKKPRFSKKTKQDLKGKPNWLEFKKQKKELKKVRKEKSNPQYEITWQAKKIWEEVRNRKCPKQKRTPLVEKLHGMLKGKLSSVIHSHDVARVVQCLLRYGNEAVRSAVCEELLPHVVVVAKSKYARFCIKPLFVYNNNKNRDKLVNAMCDNVVKMITHSIASKQLEYVYSNWASLPQKLKMRHEVYGNLFKISQDKTIKNLADLFAKNPEVRPAVLSTTKSILYKAIEKKHVMVSSLLHSVLLDYLNHCDSIERNELLESLHELVMQLLTSRDGTVVAMNMVWFGTNKTRKTIVKLLKTHVKEVSQLEHGHLLLLTIFDYVDDTVLIKKALFPELISVAEEMAVDEIGRRVLLHLTAHHDKGYFHPAEIQLLQRGEEICTSKKEKSIKHKELLKDIINPLLEFIANNTSHWLSNSSVGMLTLAIFKAASDTAIDSSRKLIDAAHRSISSYLVNASTEFFEDAGLNFVIKKLIQLDKVIIKSANEEKCVTLSNALADALTESVIESWVKINRACFLLVGVLESEDKAAIETLTSKITKSIKKVLKNETTTGSKVLYKKITDNK